MVKSKEVARKNFFGNDLTFCRFGVVLHTAGFPRHKNNAAAGEDVATIPALRKDE